MTKLLLPNQTVTYAFKETHVFEETLLYPSILL